MDTLSLLLDAGCRMKSKVVVALFAGFAALGAQSALADIFSFKDEKGVVHFTNLPDDKRYRLVRREAGSPPSASAARSRCRASRT